MFYIELFLALPPCHPCNIRVKCRTQSTLWQFQLETRICCRCTQNPCGCEVQRRAKNISQWCYRFCQLTSLIFATHTLCLSLLTRSSTLSFSNLLVVFQFNGIKWARFGHKGPPTKLSELSYRSTGCLSHLGSQSRSRCQAAFEANATYDGPWQNGQKHGYGVLMGKDRPSGFGAFGSDIVTCSIEFCHHRQNSVGFGPTTSN